MQYFLHVWYLNIQCEYLYILRCTLLQGLHGPPGPPGLDGISGPHGDQVCHINMLWEIKGFNFFCSIKGDIGLKGDSGEIGVMGSTGEKVSINLWRNKYVSALVHFMLTRELLDLMEQRECKGLWEEWDSL